MKRLLKIRLLFFMTALTAIFTACEEDITLDMPQGEEKIVVEGYIEPGMPPYVILTKTKPYFSSSSITDIKGIFVHGADVRIVEGNDTVQMMEIVLNNLPDSLFNLIKGLLGISLSKDQLKNIDYSFYTTLTMTGQAGKTYTLLVNTDKHKLTAKTTIPIPLVPDSVWTEPHPDPKIDSLVQLRFKITDRAGEKNFYRYFTKRNSEAFYPFRFASVIDDRLFDGKEVSWSLQRGDDPFSEIDPVSFTYFWKGDTITLKFCTIDEASYQFWRTKEDDQNSGGPFSSPVHVKTNINGGLGIWCGYGSAYTTIIVPK